MSDQTEPAVGNTGSIIEIERPPDTTGSRHWDRWITRVAYEVAGQIGPIIQALLAEELIDAINPTDKSITMGQLAQESTDEQIDKYIHALEREKEIRVRSKKIKVYK